MYLHLFEYRINSLNTGLFIMFFMITNIYNKKTKGPTLTFRRRNFLLNFSTPVFKMWIIQEPKKVAFWNKRHFEEEKTESVQHV